MQPMGVQGTPWAWFSSKIYRIFDSSFTMVLWYKFIEIHKKIATLDLGKRLRFENRMAYALQLEDVRNMIKSYNNLMASAGRDTAEVIYRTFWRNY